jgi:hypothetical protein
VNFTVGWEPDTWAELHQLWATLPDPAAERTAAETAERLLADDPVGNGQLLSEGLWRIVVSPLALYYTIDPARRHVQFADILATG